MGIIPESPPATPRDIKSWCWSIMAAAAVAMTEGDCEDMGGPLIWWLRSLEARVAESSKWKATLLSGLDGGISSERSRGLRS
jgi:hypothetical protein